MRLLTGRQKITSDYTVDDMRDLENVINVLNDAMLIHGMNKLDIDYLLQYRNGIQPILSKEKLVRDEINNTLVINHAQMITRNIVGYFLGNPIQYILNGDSNKKNTIDELNRYVQFEDKATTDKEIGEYQSITGTAYRIIYRDGLFGDEVPFEDRSLNPSTTFVVYENTISERPLLGVTYYSVTNENNKFLGFKVYVYTKFGRYEFLSNNSHFNEEDLLGFEAYNVGGVPIIEYPNNIWRVGDWELATALMDAINELNSGRLDDIDQIIQSLLVFTNAEIDTDTYDEMRKKGVVMLKNTTGSKTEVNNISNALDQGGMNLFAEEMENLLYAIIGIPNRNDRAGGGGDTGQAVELRDGWADLEIVARNKELTFKKSEKMALRVILEMFNANRSDKLSLVDIDIKFTRNKNNNMLVKTQSYETLLRTKTLTPEDCLTIVDLVSDVNEYISRGKAFWEDEFAGKVEKVEEYQTDLEV